MASYDEMTVEELRAEAAKRGIAGRSAMNKDELVEALSGAEAEKSDSAGEAPSDMNPPEPGTLPADGTVAAASQPEEVRARLGIDESGETVDLGEV